MTIMKRLLALVYSCFPILWLGLILVVTLVPLESTVEKRPILCVLCGDGAVSDGIVNAALFLPLGAALHLARWRWPGALALGAFLSVGVEGAQMLIPGRDPSLADILFNTLGTALGLALVQSASTRSRPGSRRGGVLWTSGVMGAVSVLVLTGVLLRPSFPEGTYYGSWTPDFGHLERYGGRVLAVALDGLEVPSGVVAHSAEVRRRLISGATMHVRAHPGPPPRGLAPLFTIHDRHQREIVLLGVDGDDLVYRHRTRAIAWGLLGPEIRVVDALRGVAVTDPLSLVVRPGPSGYCVTVNATERCGLGHTAGTGWALLLDGQSVKPGLRSVLHVGWLAALFVPSGLWARSGRVLLATAALALGTALILPPAIGLLPTPWVQFLAILAGVLVGWVCRPWT